jgi:hypothetical protein
MSTKTLKFLRIALVSIAFLFFLTTTVHAATSILPTCVSEGYCTLCDILQLAINFGKFLLGIVGSLALLMFVYGGLMWLTSGGEASRIEAGKKILINSVVGVAITFFAWVVVAFVVSSLTTGNSSFKWDVELTCAKLPPLEQISLEDRDYGTADSAVTPAAECISKVTKESCEKDTNCQWNSPLVAGDYCVMKPTQDNKTIYKDCFLDGAKSVHACVSKTTSGCIWEDSAFVQ